MRARPGGFTLGVSALLLQAAGAGAAPQLDQEFTPFPAFEGLSTGLTRPIGQSFTVGLGGTLSSVELFLSRDANASGDLTVSIHSTNGIQVASGAINLSDVPEDASPDGSEADFVALDVSSAGHAVLPGDVLTIWLTQQPPGYSWFGNTGDPYASGAAFQSGTVVWPGRDFGFRTFVDGGGPTYSCEGFQPPLASGPVTVKKNRVLPHKGLLLDEYGAPQDDLSIAAPPVIQVLFEGGMGGDPVDVSSEALPNGAGTDGNVFEFLGSHWQFNLKIRNYTAAGTYTVSMISGDESEYSIDPTCEATFVIY